MDKTDKYVKMLCDAEACLSSSKRLEKPRALLGNIVANLKADGLLLSNIDISNRNSMVAIINTLKLYLSKIKSELRLVNCATIQKFNELYETGNPPAMYHTIFEWINDMLISYNPTTTRGKLDSTIIVFGDALTASTHIRMLLKDIYKRDVHLSLNYTYDEFVKLPYNVWLLSNAKKLSYVVSAEKYVTKLNDTLDSLRIATLI